MARSKVRVSKKKTGRPPTGKARKRAAPPKQSTESCGKPPAPAVSDFQALDDKSLRASLSRFTLADDARAVLARSGWKDVEQQQLTRECQALLKKLQKTCPKLTVQRPLKAGEVLGDIAIDTKRFHALFSVAAGAKEKSQMVWSDGTNELLVAIAGMSVKTLDGLVQVTIPVSCEETGRQTILVTFATGSAKNPTGLIFATDTIPEGPPEIVEIWGEALIALAWTSVLRVLSTLANVSGADLDGAGLIPVGLAASNSGVKLLVMARHTMDRIVR